MDIYRLDHVDVTDRGSNRWLSVQVGNGVGRPSIVSLRRV